MFNKKKNQQGKEWNKEKVIEVLKPYLKNANSIRKACRAAGISQSTVQTWIDNDSELRLKITSWQNEISEMARENWRNKIKSGDFTASKEWLIRKEKDEFCTKQESTDLQDQSTTTDIHNLLIEDDITKPIDSTDSEDI